MTKELFIKCIDTIKQHRERENKFLEGLDAVSPDTYNDTFIYCDYEALTIEMLEDAMNDKSEVIAWWIYDTEFGKNPTLSSIFIGDDEHTIATAEDLYTYLTK